MHGIKQSSGGIHNMLSWWPHCQPIRSLLLVAAITLNAPMQAGASDLLTFTVTAKDGQFSPNTLNVPAGVRFKIVVRNQGHDTIEFESLQLRKEKVLAAGAESFVVISPLKPGEYDFFDEFHSDTGRARIIVK